MGRAGNQRDQSQSETEKGTERTERSVTNQERTEQKGTGKRRTHPAQTVHIRLQELCLVIMDANCTHK